MTEKALTVATIGHSTRTLAEFLKLLKAHGVKRVADVRSIPRSRHTPQFNRPRLSKKLRHSGTAYIHLRDLGGRRHTTKASINTGWRNASFRGFADYMLTQQFQKALARLIKLYHSEENSFSAAVLLHF